MKYLILTLAFLVLTACAQQRQDAANAVAGIDALETLSEAPEAPAIAEGARQYVLASHRLEGRHQLPQPNRLPQEIIEYPAEYGREAEAAVASAQSSWLLAGAGGLTALLLMGWGAVRKSGVGGPIVEVIARALEKPNGPHRRTQAPQGARKYDKDADHA